MGGWKTLDPTHLKEYICPKGNIVIIIIMIKLDVTKNKSDNGVNNRKITRELMIIIIIVLMMM